MSGGEGFDALTRAGQPLVHECEILRISDRAEVERPDDTFHKNLRVGPAVGIHVRRVAQCGELILQRLQLRDDGLALGVSKRAGGGTRDGEL